MSGNKQERELRMGVVLYGGVSLCIYIFGVAYEFLRLVRRKGAYAELADMAGVDPVVDIISGTSAGGINGLVLAKALTTGAELEPLKNLWIESGDLESLIDTQSKEPLSLLDSQNYHRLIQEALDAVDQTADPENNPPSSILDLWITATDLDGVPWQFSDDLGTAINTKFHNSVFHFKHRGYDETARLADDGREQNRLLAKVAAATSSFPVAFAPVALCAEEKKQMRELFGEQVCPRGYDHDSVYGDGGMLNNKPFSHTSSTIFRRQANRPVDRKLFYVEPDPGQPDQHPRLAHRDPAANGLDTLTGLSKVKMHESITSDLDLVMDWNRKVQDLREDLIGLEQSLLGLLQAMKKSKQDTREGHRNLFQAQPQFASYQNLKLRRIARNLGLEPAEGEDPGAFLRDLDYPFRIRRIRFFIDRINLWLEAEGAVADEALYSRLFGGPGSFKGRLYDCIEGYLRQAYQIRSKGLPADKMRAEFAKLMQTEGPEPEVQKILAEMEVDCARLRKNKLTLQELYEAFEFLDMHLYPARERSGLGEVDPLEVVRISPDAATRYIRGPNAVQEKLAGEKVMHFSAFLKKSWRENDLIWGRLDAAEIIVRTLLPDTEPDSGDREKERKAILDQLCPAIIEEELSSIRLRRMEDIDSGMLRSRFKDAQAVKKILMDIQQLTSATGNPGAIEDYFRNRYRVGVEELGDLDKSAMLRTGAKGLRAMGRVLNWVPKELERTAVASGGVVRSVKEGIALFMRRILKRLNQAAEILHFLVVTLRGDKHPLLLMLAILAIIIIVLLWLYVI